MTLTITSSILVNNSNKTILKNDLSAVTNDNARNETVPIQKVFAQNLFSTINFKQNKKSTITSLVEQNLTNEEFISKLNEILKNEKDRNDFFDDLFSNISTSKQQFAKLKEKNGENALSTIFSRNKDYEQAFLGYMNSKIENAKNIDDVIKIRPDINEETLRKVALKNTFKDSIVLGKLPTSISEKDFTELVKYIQTQINNFNEFLLKDDFSFNSSEDNTFKLKILKKGCTLKHVFELTTKENEKFVLKVEPARRGKIDFRCPTTLLNSALIDRYATLHGCEGSATLYYHNEDLTASLYEKIEGDKTAASSDNTQNTDFSPISELGLSFSDTFGKDNFFFKNGKTITVDSDHVTYYPLFNTPYHTPYTAPFLDLMYCAF